MKLQLDTTNKTIKIEENVKVSKLIEVLKKILPNDWKDFILETQTTITYWEQPTIIRTYPRPYEYPWYYCDGSVNMKATNDNKWELKAGTYNVEV